MEHRGGQKETAVPNQMVEITTEIQAPDSDERSRRDLKLCGTRVLCTVNQQTQKIDSCFRKYK